MTHIPQNAHAGVDWHRIVGVLFLSVGLFDAIVVTLLTFIWILEPNRAPEFRVVAAVPVVSLLLIVVAPFVRNRIPRAGTKSLAVSQATRWWALCGLLLSLPALAIAYAV